MFSAAALFPLEVIKTNLQAHTKQKQVSPLGTASSPTEDGEEEEEEEGKAALAAEGEGGEALPSSGSAGAGGGDEEKDQRRLARHTRHEAPSVVSVARDIHAREGLSGFYNGVWYAAGQSGLEKAAYFYGYGWLKALALRGGGGGGLSTATDLGLGYLAEAFHLPLTIPIEVRQA